MNRCGVEPGEPALALARRIAAEPGLRFVGLQGYDGHLQMLPDPEEKRAKCSGRIERLAGHAPLDRNRPDCRWRWSPGRAPELGNSAASHEALTELQPGSFLLMDAAYHAVRPEFGCSLSVLATVISRRPGWYVLDAGSKAISQDFGKPAIKGSARRAAS